MGNATTPADDLFKHGSSNFAVSPTVSACHITNYAKNTDGWVWNLEEVKQHFGEAVWGEVWDRMLHSAGLTVAAARQSLHEATEWLQPSISNYGFQVGIFGRVAKVCWHQLTAQLCDHQDEAQILSLHLKLDQQLQVNRLGAKLLSLFIKHTKL